MFQLSMNTLRRFLVVASCGLLFGSLLGCNDGAGKPIGSKSSESPEAVPNRVSPIAFNDKELVAAEISPNGDSGSGQFVDLPSRLTGVEFTNQWPDRLEQLLENSFISAGVAAGDFNNDGLVDFFAARRSDGGRLYQNLGKFKFMDVTEKFGLTLSGTWGTGATWADVSSDGRLDLYVCGYNSHNHLFVNHGDHFVDETKAFGLDFKGASVIMTFCDIDRDGDLDAFLLTNRIQRPRPDFEFLNTPEGPRVPEQFREDFHVIKRRDGRFQAIPSGQYDHLYENRDGKFVEITDQAGIGRHPYHGLSATWWDYNNDGWPDLYVANDFEGSEQLYRNNGIDEHGKIQFSDVTQEALPHTPWYSMGSDAADVNNDGRLDLLASDMAGTNHYRDKLSMGAMSGPDSFAWFLNWPNPPQYKRNCLYLNSGIEQFFEAAYMLNVAKTNWSWTVRFADFDLDGWQDGTQKLIEQPVFVDGKFVIQF